MRASSPRLFILLLPLLGGCEAIRLYYEATLCDEEGIHEVNGACEDDVPPYVIPGDETGSDTGAADDSAPDSPADDSDSGA
ncbi:MAG: hypothetical protein H6741_35270 [Alphaproteobacteria bacterium]|nr:hypothetical protein [Alphaproteobacteria bacterium]